MYSEQATNSHIIAAARQCAHLLFLACILLSEWSSLLFGFPLSLPGCRTELGKQGEVSQAAHMFRKLCYDYREQLSAGIIVAGWDKQHGGQVSIDTKKAKTYFKVQICYWEHFACVNKYWDLMCLILCDARFRYVKNGCMNVVLLLCACKLTLGLAAKVLSRRPSGVTDR